jgi:predicted transcriptional regulator
MNFCFNVINIIKPCVCTLSSIATIPKVIFSKLDVYRVSEVDNIGMRIFKVRNGQKLTAKELGQLTGISPASIINYENGYAYPSRDALLKLIRVLGKDILCDDYSKFIVADYGPIIKQWRRTKNLSCGEAAEYIGVSMRTLYSLENMEYILGRRKFEEHKVRLREVVGIT